MNLPFALRRRFRRENLSVELSAVNFRLGYVLLYVNQNPLINGDTGGL